MGYTVALLIVSDRAAAGKRIDECLPVVRTALKGTDFELSESSIVSDDPSAIRETLSQLIEKGYDLIFTSGGTGCGPRDNTPEVTKALLDRFTPGVDEAIRAYSQGKSPYAMFSRAASGVAGSSFVINLPGSPKAVGEILAFILPVMAHPLKLIAGAVTDCQEDLHSP